MPPNMDLMVRILGDASSMEHAVTHVTHFAREQFTAMVGFFSAQFTAEAVFGSFKESLNYANTAMDNAEATGVNVEKLQALELVMKSSGASTEKLQRAFFMLQQAQSAIATSAEGSDKLASAFERLGISQEQVITSSPDRILELIGAKLASGGNEAESFAAALELLGGKVGGNFIAALKEIGREGLDHLTEKMKQSGLVMEEELAKRLDTAKKTLERLEQLKTVAAGKITDAAVTTAMQAFSFADNDEARAYLEGNIEQYRRAQVRAKEIFAKENPGKSTKEDVVTGGYGGAYATSSVNTAEFEATRKRALEQIKSEDAAAAAKQKAADDQQKIKDAAAAKDKGFDDKRAVIEKQISDERAKRLYDELGVLQKIQQVRVNIETLQNQQRGLGETSEDLLLMKAQLRLQETQQNAELASQQKNEKSIRAGADKEIESAKNTPLGQITPANRLSSIGGYVGSQVDPMIRVQERSIVVQERIRDILAEMNQKLNTEGGVKD